MYGPLKIASDLHGIASDCSDFRIPQTASDLLQSLGKQAIAIDIRNVDETFDDIGESLGKTNDWKRNAMGNQHLSNLYKSLESLGKTSDSK